MTEKDQEAILEEQRKNCIFCRIVNGEMESKKVYEDDDFLAVLDIRPAAPGHVLLLPKEHVPLLPLLQPGKIVELFKTAGKLRGAIKQALAAESVTIFVASGAAAGQQAPHLLVHIIPREPGDGLSELDIHGMTVHQADTIAASSVFQQATQEALKHLGRSDLLQGSMEEKDTIRPVPAAYEEIGQAPVQQDEPATPPVQQDDTGGDVQEFADTNEALQTVLETNPELRKLIIAEPNMVADYIEQSPRLQKLFEGVNIQALSLMLRRQEESQKETGRAADMDEEDLFRFIDGNEGLRTWLLDHPAELAQNLEQNPRLKAFFAGLDIMDLAERYRRYRHAG